MTAYAGIDLSLTSTGALTESQIRSICRKVLDPAQRLRLLSRDLGDCRVWIGKVDSDGYGKTRIQNGRSIRVHRLAWTLANGPIPPGMVVRHRCDNPPCIRDSHLDIGTAEDNNHDRDLRGRTSRGAAHYASKLTPEQVREIRQRTRSGESVVAVAKEFKVRPWTIQKIRDGLTWRSLP